MNQPRWTLEYTLSDGTIYRPSFVFNRFCSLCRWLQNPKRQKTMKVLGVLHVQPLRYSEPEVVG